MCDMKGKKPIIVCIIAVVIVVVGIVAAVLCLRPQYPIPGESKEYPIDATMIQLIANPEKYHGKYIRVVGVLQLEYDVQYLGLSKEEIEYWAGNRIWVSINRDTELYANAEKYNGRYVLIEGVFDKKRCSNFGCGSIGKISRCDLMWTEIEREETQ